MVVHTAHSHATLHICQGDLSTVRAMAFGRTSSHYRKNSCAVYAIFRFQASCWCALMFFFVLLLNLK
jgi:hypothetical protein